MISNVSFGSMFNIEKARKSIENPENDIEGLKNEVEQAKHFPAFPQESLGRSQVKTPVSVALNDEDKKLLSSLSSKKYSFNDDGSFWVHSKTKTADGNFKVAMGDGKIADGKTRQDIVKGLVGDDVQALNIAGTKDRQNVMSTFIYDKTNGGITVYSSDLKEGQACLEFFGFDGFKAAINNFADNLDTIQGATVWK